MRASRLLSHLMHLQSQGRVSAGRLAAAAGVSVRTVYRDVDHLSAAGVPVWTEPGRHGGVCLRPGWRTQLTGLTEAEARAVFLTGLPGPARALGLGEAVAGAMPKLLAALPDGMQAAARQMGQRFHLDPVDWFREAPSPTHLQAIADAVWHGRRITLHYASWQRTSERVLEPLGLVLKAGTWYAVARSVGGEPRSYRLDAVLALQVRDEPFAPPPHFDLAAWWRANTARFEAGVYTASATLRVTEAGYARLLRFSPLVAAAATESVAPCLPDGWAEVRVPIESVAHAARELLRLGAECEVLAPAALRRALQAQAEALRALYRSDREAGVAPDASA